MKGPVPVAGGAFSSVRHASDKRGKASDVNHAAESKTCTNHNTPSSDNPLCSTTAVLWGVWLPLPVAPSAEVLFFVVFCGPGARCQAECYFLMFFVVFIGVFVVPGD